MLSLIKCFSILLLTFYSFHLLAFNCSEKEEWHEFVKQHYLDNETGLNDNKKKIYNLCLKLKNEKNF